MQANKGNRVSMEQRKKMLEYMQSNVDFARGRVTGPDAARQKEMKLNELSDILNACGSGATKTPKKWLKCWQDWRSDIKAKALKREKFINGTGGGPCPPPLSDLEELLIEFCGREMVAGVPDIEDPLEIQHQLPAQEEGPTLDEGLLHEEGLMHEEVLSPEEPSTSTAKKPKKSKDLHELLERQAVAIENGFSEMAAALREVANAISNQQKIIFQ